MEELAKIYTCEIEGKSHNQASRGWYFFKRRKCGLWQVFISPGKLVGATWVWVSLKTGIRALTC